MLLQTSGLPKGFLDTLKGGKDPRSPVLDENPWHIGFPIGHLPIFGSPLFGLPPSICYRKIEWVSERSKQPRGSAPRGY